MIPYDQQPDVALASFTVAAHALVSSAQELADRLGSRRLETAHLLGVALEHASIVEALRAAGADMESLRTRADAALGVVEKSEGAQSYVSPAMLAMLTHLESRRGEREQITVSTLLSALVNSPDALSEVFREAGIARGAELVVAEAPREPPPVIRLERFARDAKELVALAQTFADGQRRATVEPIHLLVAFGHVDEAGVVAFAAANGIDIDAVLAKVARGAPGERARISATTLALFAATEQEAAAEVTLSDLWRAVRAALSG
jgi:ATP-dependent Clp protease ATP-binding subunit ClpA